MKAITPVILDEEFEVEILPHKTIGDLVREGHYDLMCPDAKNRLNDDWFSGSGQETGSVIMKLLSFQNPLSLEDADSLLREVEIPYASTSDLLFFGAQFPFLQKERDIVSIDGFSEGCSPEYKFRPMLFGNVNQRMVRLCNAETILYPRSTILIRSIRPKFF